ncbi:hypothetical protein [Streptomyces sp. DSM 40750]|uniref:hypothetical protein n=1 Tax=Streptomyces sp. DSM 40750 TaxID=2801030 RepID=UPI00214BCB67|nr:hypothetical protein [Streptomyces sp. DSM 40750]UUU23762.1 hypothetical protein JIX55_27820 [Streptomyces sp. DSM 40750]
MNPADVALVVVRRVCPDSFPPTALPTDAAAAIYGTFVRFPRAGTRTLLVVTVITAVVAYPYGPGHPARAVRTTVERGTTTTARALDRVGVRTGATGRRLSGHPKWTTTGVIAAGALAPVLWNHPPVGAMALVLCIDLAAVLLLVAVLAAISGPAAGHEDRAAAP